DIAYDMFSRQGRNSDAFFNNLEPLISQIVYMVAPGNHEYMPIVGDNGANFKHRFKMPTGNNDYYTFTCGPIRFVIISTELYYAVERKFGRTKKMIVWLQKTLTEANKNRRKQPWIIAIGHKPFYCSDSKPLRCKNGHAFVK
ncbi:iron/zinc purple acid phosphatase-like protein, partial [Leptotrombidium deliense]